MGQLTCDCYYVALFVRILAVIALGGCVAAGVWVALLGITEYNANTSVTSSSFVSNSRLGIFHVLDGGIFALCALLGIIAELRLQCLRRTILQPFTFLHTLVGRGCAYILLGVLFCAIPISLDYITVTPGAGLCIAGVLEIILGCCVVKESRVRGGGSGSGKVTQIRRVADLESPIPGSTGKVNLVKSVDGDEHTTHENPAETASDGVPTTNPFRLTIAAAQPPA